MKRHFSVELFSGYFFGACGLFEAARRDFTSAARAAGNMGSFTDRRRRPIKKALVSPGLIANRFKRRRQKLRGTTLLALFKGLSQHRAGKRRNACSGNGERAVRTYWKTVRLKAQG